VDLLFQSVGGTQKANGVMAGEHGAETGRVLEQHGNRGIGNRRSLMEIQSKFLGTRFLIDMTRSRKLHQQITDHGYPINRFPTSCIETGQGSALSRRAASGVDAAAP